MADIIKALVSIKVIKDRCFGRLGNCADLIMHSCTRFFTSWGIFELRSVALSQRWLDVALEVSFNLTCEIFYAHWLMV